MSFDFMVFDPDIAPRNDEGFHAWFQNEVDDETGTASQDSAIAVTDAIHQWYREMREMFTPSNGPDKVELPTNASPARALRTCEYYFRPRSVYLCFRWPAQDMARAAASTLAKEFGLGYYHVSAQHGQAVFPDGTTVWPTGKYPGFGSGKTTG